jgi:hypothetical protein
MLIITKKTNRLDGRTRPGSPNVRVKPEIYNRCAAISWATGRGIGEVHNLLLEYALDNCEIQTEDEQWKD